MNNNITSSNRYSLFQLKILVKSRMFYIFLMSAIGTNYLLSDSAIRIAAVFRVPIKSVTYWHGVYECLNSTSLGLFIFTVFYLLFLFYSMSDLKNMFFISRFRRKKSWLLEKRLFMIALPIIYTCVYISIMMIGNLFFFGVPNSMNWGSYKISNLNPIEGIVLSFFVKAFLLSVLSWLFLYCYVNIGDAYRALVVCLTYYIFCFVCIRYLPDVVFIKPIAILGGISLQYFEMGSFGQNLFYVFGIGFIYYLFFYSFTLKNLIKFEI